MYIYKYRKLLGTWYLRGLLDFDKIVLVIFCIFGKDVEQSIKSKSGIMKKQEIHYMNFKHTNITLLFTFINYSSMTGFCSPG